MIPVSRLVYENLVKVYGESLTARFYHVAPLGFMR